MSERRTFLEELLVVPPRHMDFRVTPEVRSVRELIQHILEVAMMMTGELTRPDTNLRRAPWPKLLRMHAGPAYRATTRSELVRLLRSQLRDAERKFRSVGDLAMYQFITRFDGEQGTKMAWLHHGIAHEEYHRAQLTLYARSLELEPALTRRIRGG